MVSSLFGFRCTAGSVSITCFCALRVRQVLLCLLHLPSLLHFCRTCSTVQATEQLLQWLRLHSYPLMLATAGALF